MNPGYDQRVELWKKKYISSAGRGLLIKSVAQANLTYAMSSFPFPNYLCRVKCNDEQVLVGIIEW